MGIKDLWSILTPYCERRPIFELHGKVVAVDLAGWVCESLNTVDYFVHPRNHLKTCYLIWEDVTPVFVLEGKAPELKESIMSKRKEINFRGVKPKPKSKTDATKTYKTNGRTRFDQILRQCEMLLNCMGVNCIQAPGEAEAYCAFLNKKGLVDGVISQDSDCFAYGALRVYRNFSVSTQGAAASNSGSIDIYDMNKIQKLTDFGQNKVIIMAILCGCDYCPNGIDGIGRDGVLKLFNNYTDREILNKIRSWRQEDSKYTELELRVDDKTICTNCGHTGRVQKHLKTGCGLCKTLSGCDETLWKEKRMNIKAELIIRKKALSDPSFPFENIINEFLSEPNYIPNLSLTWRQPNVVKFVMQIGPLLQWSEIYCFQKVFPLLTRWQIRYPQLTKDKSFLSLVIPKEIKKMRTLKGERSLEVYWSDEYSFFKGLIPDIQLNEFANCKVNCADKLWTTIEPLSLMENSYTDLVTKFLFSKKKIKKTKNVKQNYFISLEDNKAITDPLNDLKRLTDSANEIANTVKIKTHKNNASRKGLQMINNFFHKSNTKYDNTTELCSSPFLKNAPFELDDCENDNIFDLSDVVKVITKTNPVAATGFTKFNGRNLKFEPMLTGSKDDLDLLNTQKPINNKITLDDSFNFYKQSTLKTGAKIITTEADKNASYFFNSSGTDFYDEFEKVMDINFTKYNDSSEDE